MIDFNSYILKMVAALIIQRSPYNKVITMLTTMDRHQLVSVIL